MSDKSRSFLVNWTMNFVKNKDIISKKIELVENGKNGFDLYVKFKDKEQFFIVDPEIVDIEKIVQKINGNAHFAIVTLNSRNNLDLVIKNWDKLVNFKFLSIIFVNPFSSLDKKWVIHPYTHNKICDESSLKIGLKAMFEMVDPIEESQLVAKITS